MKKIILSILMITCSLFFFTACDNLGETYWKDTHAKLSEVFVNEDLTLAEDFAKAYEISYNTNIQTIMSLSCGSLYVELMDVFDPLFESAISYAYFHYKDLQITPKNNNSDFKNAIKTVNENLTKFKNSLKNFNNEKELFESWIDKPTEEEANKPDNLSRLQLLKREYITLIENSYKLSSSIFNARKVGYYNFSNYSDEKVILQDASADCDLAISASNLEILDVAIKIVREYNSKEVASEYQSFWQSANNYYTSVITAFKEGNLTPVENAKENLYKWNIVYNMFKTEKTKLFNVIKNIDLELLVDCNNDLDIFEEETNNNSRIYAEYYLNFYKNINVLNKYSVSLFK